LAAGSATTAIRPETLAERIWPYLQAHQDGDILGNARFDLNVNSTHHLALFLVRRIICPTYDDLI
jgi:hypothetical protein